jgi:hypothetical protein
MMMSSTSFGPIVEPRGALGRSMERGYASGGSAKSPLQMAQRLQRMGNDGDTILAHINWREAALLKARGGAGTINPRTGLLQFDEGSDGPNGANGNGNGTGGGTGGSNSDPNGGTGGGTQGGNSTPGGANGMGVGGGNASGGANSGPDKGVSGGDGTPSGAPGTDQVGATTGLSASQAMGVPPEVMGVLSAAGKVPGLGVPGAIAGVLAGVDAMTAHGTDQTDNPGGNKSAAETGGVGQGKGAGTDPGGSKGGSGSEHSDSDPPPMPSLLAPGPLSVVAQDLATAPFTYLARQSAPDAGGLNFGNPFATAHAHGGAIRMARGGALRMAQGGALMRSISDDVEDRQDPNAEISRRRAGNDPIVYDTEGMTADQNERDDRHLPSDFKQRQAVRGRGDQLLPEEPSLARGGAFRRYAEGGEVDASTGGALAQDPAPSPFDDPRYRRFSSMPIDQLQDTVDSLPRMSRDGQMARHALSTRQSQPQPMKQAQGLGMARGGLFGALGRAA